MKKLVIPFLLFTLFAKESLANDTLRFKKFKEFDFTLPDSCNHTNLVKGKTYKVKIFQIISNIRTQDCKDFVYKDKAVFVGIHGLELMYWLAKDKLPQEEYIVSFDGQDSFNKNSKGKFLFPYVYIRPNCDLGWFGGTYVDTIELGNYLLYFTEK